MVTYAGARAGQPRQRPPCAPARRWPTPSTSAASSSRGGRAHRHPRPRGRPAGLAGRERQGRPRGTRQRGPPAGRQPVPPRHRHAVRLADAHRGRDPGPGGAQRAAVRHPRAATNIAHSNDQHDAVVAGHPRRRRRRGRGRRWRSTATPRPPCCAGSSDEDSDRPGDPHDRPTAAHRRASCGPTSPQGSSTRSSSPSPTCRVACRASGSTASSSSTPCSGHGTEGCNYLLAVDVDMNTVDGYAISSWERGYGDMMFDLDLDHPATHPRPALLGDRPVRPLVARRQRPRPRVAAVGAQGPGRRGRRARASSP